MYNKMETTAEDDAPGNGNGNEQHGYIRGERSKPALHTERVYAEYDREDFVPFGTYPGDSDREGEGERGSPQERAYAETMPVSRIIIGRRVRLEMGDLHALAQNIREVGLLQPPVVKPDGTLLAGARRVEAIREHIREWTEIPVRVVTTPTDALKALKIEVSENTERKDFTPYEVVLATKQIEGLVKAAAHERQVELGRTHGTPYGNSPQGVPQVSQPHPRPQEPYAERGTVRDILPKLVGANMSGRTYEKAKAIVEAADPDFGGDPEAYGDLLEAMHTTGAVSPHYQRLRQRQLHARLADNPPPPLASLEGPFTVIYADPPWKYEGGDTVFRWSIENHYPTMPLDEICGLDIPAMAAPDAVLFLWATAPKFAEACRLVEAWGFEYRTNIVWEKPGLGMGHWARINHEHLIVAKRGNMPTPPDDTLPASVIKAPKGEHSEKPESFYDLIERMTPTARPGSRIELFARKPRPGWVSWGLDATLEAGKGEGRGEGGGG